MFTYLLIIIIIITENISNAGYCNKCYCNVVRPSVTVMHTGNGKAVGWNKMPF